jgi:hypothetical protein
MRHRQIVWGMAGCVLVLLLVLALPVIGRECDQPAVCRLDRSGNCEPGPCDRQAARDMRQLAILTLTACGVAVMALVVDRRVKRN